MFNLCIKGEHHGKNNDKARMGCNPATGETIKIPAKKVVMSRNAKVVKDAILGQK